MNVYANEIRRLAGLARFEGPSLEHTVKLTFINGLPDYMSVQLQQVGGILDLSIAEILTKARALTAHKATTMYFRKFESSFFANIFQNN